MKRGVSSGNEANSHKKTPTVGARASMVEQENSPREIYTPRVIQFYVGHEYALAICMERKAGNTVQYYDAKITMSLHTG